MTSTISGCGTTLLAYTSTKETATGALDRILKILALRPDLPGAVTLRDRLQRIVK